MLRKYIEQALREGEIDEEDETTNLILKIVSIVVFLGMATFFGVIPYFCTKCRTSTKFLGIANAFSGGLFLGIGLFHVLPEGAEKLESLTEAPVAYFCAFLSYALILFVEKILCNSHSLLHEHGHEHHDEKITLSKLNESGVSEGKKESEEQKDEEKDEHKDEKNEVLYEEKKEEHEHNHDEHHHGHMMTSGITPYILLLALGFHGLFEGMALGIQDKIQDTLFLFLAIAAHKWAASLTLGISFVKAEVTQKQLIIMVLIFAFIGPVGIAFGLILSSTASDTVEGIFLAISVGTFIYIACSEVIVEEFEKPDNKYVKFGMFMVGGIFTSLLSLMELLGGVED